MSEALCAFACNSSILPITVAGDAGQRVIVAHGRADGTEIARGVAAAEMGEIAHDAGLAVAFGLGVGLGDVDPARDVHMAARRIGAQARRRLHEQRAIVRALPR
jgi:hypothetical protein